MNEVLFLGVVLDEHLSWKSQIQNVERKVSTESVGIIYKPALIRTPYVLSIIVQFILIYITVPAFGAQLISQILSVCLIFRNGLLAERRRAKRACGAPWVSKCGKLPIRENLVIT